MPRGFGDVSSWETFNFQPNTNNHETEEECQSVALSSRCCDSQCGPAEPCTGSSCASEASACFDTNCPAVAPAVTPEVADAAAALTSIGGTIDQQPAFFPLFPTDFDGQEFSGSQLAQTSSFDAQFYQSEIDFMKEHLLGQHADPSSSSLRTAMYDRQPLYFSACHFTQPGFEAFPPDLSFSAEAVRAIGLDHHGGDGTIHQHSFDCGARIKDGDEFISHFNTEHRPVIATSSVLPNAEPHPSANLVTAQGASVGSGSSGPSTATSPLDPFSTSTEDTPTTLSSPEDNKGSASCPSTEDTPETSVADVDNCCMWRESPTAALCGATFENSQDLFAHVTSCHIKNLMKSASGFHCGWKGCRREGPEAEGFPQRSKIERHMQTHAAHKPYTCDICHKNFSAKQALDQHVLIHTGTKPLVCDWPGCGATFRQNSALTMHKRTHTGEKPLRCEECGKCFSESSNLSKHRRTHETKGRFTCEYPGCSRDFHRQDQLRRHMKQHQPKDGTDAPEGEAAALATADITASPSWDEEVARKMTQSLLNSRPASKLGRKSGHQRGNSEGDFAIRKSNGGVKKRNH